MPILDHNATGKKKDNKTSVEIIFLYFRCVSRVFWCTHRVIVENPEAERMQSPVIPTLKSLRPLFLSFLAPSVRGLDSIGPSPDRARRPCINQSWRSAEWWANQLDPGEEAKSSCGLASSDSFRKEGGERKGRGRSKSVSLCVCERERERYCKENSKLARIKVKEEGWEQDGDQTANEEPWDAVTQLDVYTETGRGSGYLHLKQAVVYIELIGFKDHTVMACLSRLTTV